MIKSAGCRPAPHFLIFPQSREERLRRTHSQPPAAKDVAPSRPQFNTCPPLRSGAGDSPKTRTVPDIQHHARLFANSQLLLNSCISPITQIVIHPFKPPPVPALRHRGESGIVNTLLRSGTHKYQQRWKCSHCIPQVPAPATPMLPRPAGSTASHIQNFKTPLTHLNLPCAGTAVTEEREERLCRVYHSTTLRFAPFRYTPYPTYA
jgi:hypothetical protein